MERRRIDLDDQVMTAEEAGKMFNVGAAAMYQRARKGMLPSHRMGRKVYFLRSEVIESIKNN